MALSMRRTIGILGIPLVALAAGLGFQQTRVSTQSGSAIVLRYELVQSTGPLIIDGNLEDLFWQAVPVQALSAGEPGVPAELAGEIRLCVRGAELCLAARCPEPGGKVLARSVGRNPVWEKDATGSTEVEDRVRYQLKYQARGGREQSLDITVNPWGALRLEREGEAVPTGGILAAATVSPAGWAAEVVLPLSLLDLESGTVIAPIHFQAERVRSRRPLAPEFRWVWPGTGTHANLVLPPLTSLPAHLPAPSFRPPMLGNAEPPLEVGRVQRVPSVRPEWDDPTWDGIPVFRLARNEPYPRASRYPTEVKWVHDGRTLALLIRAEEPEPVVTRAGGRDSPVTQDDHVAIYLASGGSAFLQIATNPVGALLDAKAIGPRIARPATSWNAPIEIQTSIRYGVWTARINLPLWECAVALGETEIPRNWRVLISRYRAPRPGEPAEASVLPVVVSPTFYGPVRYRRMILRDVQPSEVTPAENPYERPPGDGLVGELAALESQVWSALDRRYHTVRSMVADHARKRAERAILAERHDWESVKTRADWERFRDLRLQALRQSIGDFPAERPPLDVQVTSRSQGNGYRLENLVYQSRPGFYVAANLYLPDKPLARMPAIVIQHSQHYPRTQGELHDMGQLWARVGCAVLILERLGFGERVETTPWHRQAYASRFTFKKQLGLVGETHTGWMAWDLIRAVDLLYERSDVARDQILVIGSVAGGGEPAAVAAALDPRISAVVPFNYDQGHVRLDADFFDQIGRQLSPWFLTASVAPRRFVRAFEFGWEGAEEPDFPNLWVSGWFRSQKVWEFYGANQNLAASQAYGLIRLSMERVSHCFSVGPQQREELYPIFQRWFNIPDPQAEDRNILPDSELSVNPYRELAHIQEARRRRPHAELLVISPAVSARLPRRPLHQMAQGMALEQLRQSRGKRQAFSPAEQRLVLRRDLATRLGDIEPRVSPQAETLRTHALSGVSVESIVLQVEEGISVPLLLLRPAAKQQPLPVVVAVAQGGKERFLSNRARTLERLTRSGVAVCLPDLRGTGETSPDPDRSDDGTHRRLAELEFSLGNTLLGARIKDLRTVVAYLRKRSDIDSRRIALWGDSFAPSNPRHLFLDELQWEGGPQIQYQAEPLGAHLVLLAALYEEGIHVVAAQGGLAGYLSVLEHAFAYVPMDIMVPGILKVGDIADIAGALAPRPLLMERLVNGRNVLLPSPEVEQALALVRQAYRQPRAAERLTIRAEAGEPDVAAWLITHLR